MMIRATNPLNRIFLCLSLLFLCLNWSCKDPVVYEVDDCVKNISEDHPNILLIIADDLGIESTPCYNTNSIRPPMPTLESLCADGLVFDNVWSNPFCAPTRASMITGKHGVRTGVLNIPTNNTLDVDEVTIQRYINEQLPDTYCQAVIGKWHLNNEISDNDYPAKMGIPHFDGFIRGTVSRYTDWTRVVNGVAGNSNKYTTTSFTDSAIDWIDDRGDSPWFLWLSYNAPHKPFHLPPRDLHSRDELSGGVNSIASDPLSYYHAMIETMDTEMGRLLASIPNDVRENTTIIFISDNGTMEEAIQLPYASNQAKGTLFQGGIHIPMVVQGAGVSRIGERESGLVNSTDIFATVANIAGVEIDEINDSKSFVPLLSAPITVRDENYTDMISGWSYRNERYKLVYKIGGIKRLYDLENDPYENTNLIETTDINLQLIIAELEAKGLALRGE